MNVNCTLLIHDEMATRAASINHIHVAFICLAHVVNYSIILDFVVFLHGRQVDCKAMFQMIKIFSG